MKILVQISAIFEDSLAVKSFIVAVTICLLSSLYRFMLGIHFTLLFIISLTLITHVIQSANTRRQLQEFVETLLKSKLSADNTEPPQPADDSKIFLARGLDNQLERFGERLLNQFIKSWWSDVSRDETFIYTLKLEVAHAARRLVSRYRTVDYPRVLSSKLLPIVYSHFSQIEHSIKADCSSNEQLIKSFLEAQTPHPATLSRNAELHFLRSLAESIMPYLFSMSNFKCRVAYDIVRELLANWVFLQITDIISEADTINTLVILATNQNSTPISALSDTTRVELLANFAKRKNETKVSGSDQRVDGDFFHDQEKLYNFMQHLKSAGTCGDVEILKFLLDVDHLNKQLERSNVDPARLSSLQQASEKLLALYRDSLYRGEDARKPGDLVECYSHARKYLEYKWKYDFYKSANYYKYIYGDRNIYNNFNQEKEDPAADLPSISSQKLSAKIKNAMTMKIAVDGIEDDIQVYDAMDVAVIGGGGGGSPYHHFNSMAVKLRKERGQDLDSFMQTFYDSIEQEADVGEDIAETQTKSEKKQHNRIKFGNVELFQNLFNISGQSPPQPTTAMSFIKSPSQSLLYFLSKIVNVHKVLLRLATGVLNFLPDPDKLVCLSIRRIVERLLNQAVLAHLVRELEEKLFDSKPSPPQQQPKQQEMTARKQLAIERLDRIKSGLSTNLLFLQNPILNKHLIYSFLDVLIIEGFSELDPSLMPK